MTTRKFIKSLTICLIMTFALLMLPSSALADVAPPVNPPGSNPQPGTENTQVRMLAETVLIEIQSTAELGSARVTADFSMRNLGSAMKKSPRASRSPPITALENTPRSAVYRSAPTANRSPTSASITPIFTSTTRKYPGPNSI